MATVNLIQGSFSGTLGQMVGANWRGVHVVKSRPMGTQKHNQLQTDSLRAFECLNRLSAVVAKSWWQYLGLKAKKKLPHNAVASWLKPMIRNHAFDPAAITAVVKPTTIYSIAKFEQSQPEYPIETNITVRDSAHMPTGSQLHILAVDTAGYCGVPLLTKLDTKPITITPPIPQLRDISLLHFASAPTKKGYTLYGGGDEEATGMIYSTTEQQTADIWIDGKPIYAKTLISQIIPGEGSNLTFPHGVNNMWDLIKCDATFLHDQDDNSFLFPIGCPGQGSALRVTSDSIQIEIKWDYFSTAGFRLYCTLYYTKED